MKFVALLLAAGRGTRYDPAGRTLKLLEPAVKGPHTGIPLAVAAARTLRAAMPAITDVIAVVRPALDTSQQELHRLLRAEGCRLLPCTRADEGMGASLACGVAGNSGNDGWLVALADMPALDAQSVRAVAQALAAGALTAAPVYRGQRGHPVGFSAALREDLLRLSGDAGARELLAAHPPRLIDVDDPGVLYDVDTPPDGGR